jgi:hypothetical protein
MGSATLGLCTHPMPGSTNCSAGIDGSLCNGCGDCCSRLCEVYAPTGVKICQPAEGCRVDGDICYADKDCCGAAGNGLGSAFGEGNVKCLKVNLTDVTGICRNPIGCDPEGDVCHYKSYATCGNSSARNDCCNGQGNSGTCKLDALGVPRCYGFGSGCQMAGSACAFAGDCCNGDPCLPDGSGQLHCGSAQCVSSGGACTNSSDCCPGTDCIFQPGMTTGTCGNPMGSGSGSSTCANDGQTCTQNGDCCNNDCNVVNSSGAVVACNGGTGCTCFTPLF